jgi:anti-sigma regulatory factor (Ser/Thr protein kinase)
MEAMVKISQAIEFDNDAANIGACARELLGAMESALQGHQKTRAVMLRAKFIIAELLNNAVKHSGTHSTSFEVGVENDTAFISKKDQGNPLNLIGKPQQTKHQFMVSADAMHLLYAVIKDETVHFYCKENFTIQANVNELHEHMGLLIITKASDEFTYRFQEPENIFCARLHLG